MKKFFFVSHPTREEAYDLRKELEAFVLDSGARVVTDPGEADYSVAIGGDGTVVGAFRACRAPILGINAGNVGYLARVEKENAFSAVKAVLEGRYEIETRMTLSCEAEGESFCALNDVSLVKSGVSPVSVSVSVDGTELMRLIADGIIVSTPTGSTGYSLSAGGPIADPTSELIIITPVAPHTLLNRPIVLSSGSRVVLRTEKEAALLIDGQKHLLPAGAPVSIAKSENCMHFVSFGRENFISKLREKLS